MTRLLLGNTDLTPVFDPKKCEECGESTRDCFTDRWCDLCLSKMRTDYDERKLIEDWFYCRGCLANHAINLEVLGDEI